MSDWQIVSCIAFAYVGGLHMGWMIWRLPELKRERRRLEELMRRVGAPSAGSEG